MTLYPNLFDLIKDLIYNLGNFLFEHNHLRRRRGLTYLTPYGKVRKSYRELVQGYNDHGPVHMRKAALNALIMFGLLHKDGIKFNLKEENISTAEDSKVAVLISSLLHDISM